MIITRTPFRITLGGGGTDLPSFYTDHGGFIFAMCINKYMYLMLNPMKKIDFNLDGSQLPYLDGKKARQ